MSRKNFTADKAISQPTMETLHAIASLIGINGHFPGETEVGEYLGKTKGAVYFHFRILKDIGFIIGKGNESYLSESAKDFLINSGIE